MARKDKILALRRLQKRIDTIREELGIGAPGEVLYMAELDPMSDRTVVVEGDGFGGATTMVVEGDYPLDYLTHAEKAFASEKRATDVADEIVEGKDLA